MWPRSSWCTNWSTVNLLDQNVSKSVGKLMRRNGRSQTCRGETESRKSSAEFAHSIYYPRAKLIELMQFTSRRGGSTISCGRGLMSFVARVAGCRITMSSMTANKVNVVRHCNIKIREGLETFKDTHSISLFSRPVWNLLRGRISGGKCVRRRALRDNFPFLVVSRIVKSPVPPRIERCWSFLP